MRKNSLKASFCYKTDIGKKRTKNDDQALALINTKGKALLAVCDGMGGQNKSNFAAFSAIELLNEKFTKKRIFFNSWFVKLWLSRLIREANSIIYKKGKQIASFKGSGTTLSLAFVTKKYFITAHMGDSRIYCLNDKSLDQLTEDENYAMHEFRKGNITKAELDIHPQRHILTNALGIYPKAKFTIKKYPYKGQSLLLCTDGLFNNVSSSQIESIIRGSDSVQEKANQLIAQANANDGSDNIGVVIWEAK